LASPRLKKFTNATVTDRAQLLELLREDEKSGVAYDDQEHSEGICAVGIACLDSIGREYSLSIPVPASRWASKRQLLSKLLKKTKADLLEQIERP
jgi:DNA-binding IclR family transcriptional regulator